MTLSKDLKLGYITSQKDLLIGMRSSSIENFYDQPIDSDIKRYKEIGKLTTGQGDEYATGCLLDYDYIEIHYSLLAVNLSRQ